MRRSAAALVTALVVAACGSGSHSTSQGTSSSTRSSPAAASTATTATATSPASSSTAATSTSSSQSSAGSRARTSTHATHHTHTQPPVSTPHFVVKLKIEPGGALTPPSVAIGGHTVVDLSVSNRSGAVAKLALAHGSQTLFARTLPSGQTTTKLPTLKNATYTVLVNGRARGTLTIGARAGP